MEKKTKIIIAITTSTIVIFTMAYIIVTNQKEKQRQKFYQDVLSDMNP